MTEYLKSAARSVQARKRIGDYIETTPLIASREIGAETGSDLYFKAEHLQKTGSFKFRGAMSKITALPEDKGVITASSGNHGIASAQAAALLNRPMTVYLGVGVSKAKLAKIRSYGIEVVLSGEDSGQAEVHAQEAAVKRGLTYVSPYNDEQIIAGQGTIGLELLEQAPRIDNVFIAMGGGGLISGIGSVLKSFSPQTKIYGVAAEASCALAVSMQEGKVVETEHLPTLADGVAGGMDDDSITLPLAIEVVDEVVTCSEDEIASALAQLAIKEHHLVEGAAGLALAGYLKVAEHCKGQVNVVLLCGGNFEFSTVLNVINSAENA
ncbi:pyridoxal-phosphate dependent enzyme [Pseudochrobactrum asaccharolyticum]|jgi:threonine dehydratase|uniref:Threonine dehydratase n=1 Tax=Pseudochrobactrum asaccharolyticum TaxID=354351 RepID=A0A366DMB0_9HYPH|nr:pyridoxal-phosphate dependent enzyme [Pseudochrobactrum asaccharolyticum]RBO91227.1 threonine dehydratase [Pseudochrobactrum asaccharolyticum]